MTGNTLKTVLAPADQGTCVVHFSANGIHFLPRMLNAVQNDLSANSVSIKCVAGIGRSKIASVNGSAHGVKLERTGRVANRNLSSDRTYVCFSACFDDLGAARLRVGVDTGYICNAYGAVGALKFDGCPTRNIQLDVAQRQT